MAAIGCIAAASTSTPLLHAPYATTSRCSSSSSAALSASRNFCTGTVSVSDVRCPMSVAQRLASVVRTYLSEVFDPLFRYLFGEAKV